CWRQSRTGFPELPAASPNSERRRSQKRRRLSLHKCGSRLDHASAQKEERLARPPTTSTLPLNTLIRLRANGATSQSSWPRHACSRPLAAPKRREKSFVFTNALVNTCGWIVKGS